MSTHDFEVAMKRFNGGRVSCHDLVNVEVKYPFKVHKMQRKGERTKARLRHCVGQIDMNINLSNYYSFIEFHHNYG